MSVEGKSNTGLKPILLFPVFLFVAVLITWPLPLSPGPHDQVDTLFNSWLISWNNHAILSGENPLDLPIFEGFEDGNGRNDLLLTQSTLALPLQLLGVSPTRSHNILLVLFLAFAGVAAFILASETGTSFYGSLFTGIVVILLPYFQSHLWHLQLFSVGFSILAIVYALRIIKGTSAGWQLSLLIFLQCLASLYHWYFLNLALLILALTTLFLPERKKIKRVFCFWIGGNIAAIPFLIPLLRNAQSWSVDSITSTDVASFIAPWSSSTLLGWARLDFVHPEAALWPGLAVIAGCLWLLIKGKKGKWDLFFLICFIFFALFSLGPTLVVFGKAVAPAPFRLIAKLPGCSSIRLPARAGIFALLPLVIFAGRKLGERPILAFAGALLSLATVWHSPLNTHSLTPQPWHNWIAEHNFSTILYLPISSDMHRPEAETRRLISSVPHFTPSINGYSTSLPDNYEEYADVLNQWPSVNAKLLMEELDVECIIMKGYQAHDADTIFFTDEMSVSAIIIGND